MKFPRLGSLISRTPEEYLRSHFVRRAVQPRQLPDIMTKHIYTGAMGSIWGTLIGGIFLIYFGNRIGMTPFYWGIMGAIGSWALSSEIVSALITQRFQRRKLIWFVCAFGDRTLRFIAIIIALLLWRAHSGSAAVAFIALYTAATCLAAMAAPPWWSWLADLIPENIHGRFWGRRTAWVAAVTTAAVIPASILMDRTRADWKMELTVIVFLFATVIGLLDLLIHSTIPEPMMAIPPKRNFLQEILVPIRDARFRPLLVMNAAWSFAVAVGGALAVIFCLENLKLKENFLGAMIAMTVTPAIANVLTAKWSGRLVDQAGPKKVLMWSYVFWAAIPIFNIAANPTTAVYLVSISSFIAGVSVTAAVNASNKLTTRLPPPDQRAMYTAVADTAAFIFGGIGCFFAGFVAEIVGDWSGTIAGWSFNVFHILFAGSIIMRFIVIPVFVARINDLPAMAVEVQPVTGAQPVIAATGAGSGMLLSDAGDGGQDGNK